MKAIVVLAALQSGYYSYEDIIQYSHLKGIDISEKTIRRHIKLLCNLGYAIDQNEHGLFLRGRTEKNKNIKIGASAYPILVLDILESTKNYNPDQELIARFIRLEYKCKIDRKTVGRNIKALKEFGYNIEYIQRGYVLK